MKPLIQGEIVKFDNHHTDLPFEWNSSQDIHIHKKTIKHYDGSRVTVEAKISINNDRGINFLPAKSLNNKKQIAIQQKMKEEIKEAFESRKNRNNSTLFLKEIIRFINNNNPKETSPQEIANVFNRLMRYFDLTETTGELMVNTANEYLQKYCDNLHTYYIYSQSGSIEIGEYTAESTTQFTDKGFKLE